MGQLCLVWNRRDARMMVWFGTTGAHDSIMFGLELLAGTNKLWFGLELWEQCVGGSIRFGLELKRCKNDGLVWNYGSS